MDEVSTKILLFVGINLNSMDDLDGIIINRESLLCNSKYEKIINMLPDLKRELSSTYLTSLQKTAENRQKWPLLNLVRQILHFYHYKMIPIRKSDGITLEGKKKYKRMFEIKKF
jgi:hypothetical protein